MGKFKEGGLCAHACKINNAYFTGFRMTVSKCIILHYYVSTLVPFFNVQFPLGLLCTLFVPKVSGSNPRILRPPRSSEWNPLMEPQCMEYENV